MRHFNLTEFDSKDVPGSGCHMDVNFLKMIDLARSYAGVPFIITNGFRTPEYQEDLKRRGYQVAQNSSHLIGKAADIAAPDHTKKAIIDGLYQAGFRRIGIGRTFIHCDNDSAKVNPAVWGYTGTDQIWLNYARNVFLNTRMA